MADGIEHHTTGGITRRATLAGAVAALGLAAAGTPTSLRAAAPFTFASIDGGTLALGDWAGRPVLVVNTASLCAFTPQYEELQTLWERYRERGLVVLAVPSNDFRQELGSEEEVREFCEVTFGLDLPMTEITRVRGPSAHPFYRWLAAEHGFRPRWNFNKVLIGPDGMPVRSWGSGASPLSASVVGEIEALLDP
ncbi:glutathione peroxidase [Rhodovulum sp. 12E13]|uniref:glutathione peroxidase n=1 Tax=Rhodovulum sp. 12E13 TaxID=2203891 RepID=UPI000E188160|nr:glutathione peroxidase [Rhodovulum sp. 12E13]RDC71130.1 glutathione peroxidase [Rhodovulum sp. 12E13]